ncbi:MAG: HlyC/CorC family transporter [Bdellovibrionales bacterium]|nr:HlyC/CorC family transporter [Bdellovibrionales bacterium]
MDSDGSNWLGWFGALFGALSLYVLFVLANLSVSRSRLSRIRDEDQDVELGYFGRCAERILLGIERYLLAVQLGRFVTATIVGGILFEGILASVTHRNPRLEVALLTASGSDANFPWALYCLAVIGSCAFIFFLVVQLLKAVVFTNPEKMLCIVAPMILGFHWILYPFFYLLEKLSSRIISSLGLDLPLERDLVVSAEEISEIVEHSTMAGSIEEDEGELIQGVFMFSETTVQEVMTSRKDMVTVRFDAKLDEIVEIVREHGRSRLIVVGNGLDDVRGILLVKDLINYVGKSDCDFDLEKLTRLPYFTPHNKKIDDLLQEFRRKIVHLAIVLDEHGGVDGVVTLEDLVEELVGDIIDETDIPDDEISIQSTENGDLLVDGGALIDDLNDEYDYSFPNGEYHTLAGFVYHVLGRIPADGEIIEYDGLRIKIEEMDSNRITQLRIIQTPVSSNKDESKSAA